MVNGTEWNIVSRACMCTCRCWFLRLCWHTSLHVVLHTIRFGHVHIYQKYYFRIFRVTDSDKIMVLHILAQFLYKPYILLSVEFWYAVVSVWDGQLKWNGMTMEWDAMDWDIEAVLRSTEIVYAPTWPGSHGELSWLHVDFWLKFVVNTIY